MQKYGVYLARQEKGKKGGKMRKYSRQVVSYQRSCFRWPFLLLEISGKRA